MLIVFYIYHTVSKTRFGHLITEIYTTLKISMQVWDCVCVCVSDAAAGTVKIRNATMAVSGSYRCMAQNRVGAEQCVLDLKITTRM